MENVTNEKMNGVFIPASDYEKMNGIFVHASDFSSREEFYCAFDEMKADMRFAEQSLRDVMDELYSLIANISNSCPNPMTEPFNFLCNQEDVINAYRKELIIICCKLPKLLSKLYNAHQTITTIHGEVAWTFQDGKETIPAERFDRYKEIIKNGY